MRVVGSYPLKSFAGLGSQPCARGKARDKEAADENPHMTAISGRARGRSTWAAMWSCAWRRRGLGWDGNAPKSDSAGLAIRGPFRNIAGASKRAPATKKNAPGSKNARGFPVQGPSNPRQTRVVRDMRIKRFLGVHPRIQKPLQQDVCREPILDRRGRARHSCDYDPER